jgi:hypothetical protein
MLSLYLEGFARNGVPEEEDVTDVRAWHIYAHQVYLETAWRGGECIGTDLGAGGCGDVIENQGQFVMCQGADFGAAFWITLEIYVRGDIHMKTRELEMEILCVVKHMICPKAL